MTSLCKKCQFLSADGEACCFAVAMDVPFADAKDFGGELPDECVELIFYREMVEELEGEGYDREHEALLEEYRSLAWVLEANWEAIKNE